MACIGVGAADRVVMLARKGIGIYIAGSDFCRLLKDMFGKGNSLKTFDFHIIAQGIIESHITVLLGVTRNIRGPGNRVDTDVKMLSKTLFNPAALEAAR